MRQRDGADASAQTLLATSQTLLATSQTPLATSQTPLATYSPQSHDGVILVAAQNKDEVVG